VNLRALSPLQIALLVSAALHALLLTIRFVDPQAFERVFQDAPLEVILVNAKTDEVPDKAQAIAQTSMAGGGDLEMGRATSPVPLSLLTDTGDFFEEEKAQQQLQSLERKQQLLLSQVRQQLAALPPIDPRIAANRAEQQEREEKRRQLIKLLAEIERRIQTQNAKPKKRYVSPSVREEVYAVYYDEVRRAIEDRGTERFPQSRGQKIYGELTMSVTIHHNGKIVDARIEQSSGNPVLDKQSQSIVYSAGPFRKFPPAMRRQSDQIVIVSLFKFTRDETLEAQVSTSP
jgi:periplasmic protein TonB